MYMNENTCIKSCPMYILAIITDISYKYNVGNNIGIRRLVILWRFFFGMHRPNAVVKLSLIEYVVKRVTRSFGVFLFMFKFHYDEDGIHYDRLHSDKIHVFLRLSTKYKKILPVLLCPTNI